MNNIDIYQNEKEILLLLFSQKTLYDKARLAKYFIIFLAIFNFILGIVNKTTSVYKDLLLISIFIITIISMLIKNISCKHNNLAACTQELIDRKLYGFKTESRFLENHSASELTSVANDLKGKYHKKYLLDIENSGTDEHRGVKNWYSKISPDLPIQEAILKCQNQNTYWDKCLIKCYEKLLFSLLFITLILFLILYWNQGVRNLILGLISSASIFNILITELCMVNKFLHANIAIDSIISTSKTLGVINIDFLKDLQSKIFLRRKSDLNVPSFVHKLKSNKVHSTYNRDN